MNNIHRYINSSEIFLTLSDSLRFSSTQNEDFYIDIRTNIDIVFGIDY